MFGTRGLGRQQDRLSAAEGPVCGTAPGSSSTIPSGFRGDPGALDPGIPDSHNFDQIRFDWFTFVPAERRGTGPGSSLPGGEPGGKVTRQRPASIRESGVAAAQGPPGKPAGGETPASACPAEETGVALIMTDGAGRIVEWSCFAEELLGYKAAEARKQPLHELLQSRDFFGNRITCECGVRDMLRRGEHIWRQVIGVTSASGEAMRVVLFVKPESLVSSSNLVYEVRLDARRQRGDRRATDHSRRVPAAIGMLTPAELKVLRLLSSGKRAQDVAKALNVSITTVRHHIQSILHKLEVHTQVEAISMVLQNGIL